MQNIQIGNEKSAEILIKNRANVDAQDIAGNTPVMIAMQNGKTMSIISINMNESKIYYRFNTIFFLF